MPESVLRLGVDPRPGEQGFRRFDQAADRTKGGINTLNAAIISMTAGIAVLAGGGSVVIGATRRLVAIGSAAEEVGNKFDVVMGGGANRARERLAELHDVIPATRSELERMTAGLQDMLVPMGVARDRAADLSVEFVEIAGDLASFNDVAPVQVLEAMQSALAGSSEPMRRFGVDTRVTRLETIALTEGLIAEGEELDETTRALAVMAAVQRDSADAMGDAARTADGNANALKRMGRDRRQMIEDLGVMASEALETSGALVELAESVEEIGRMIGRHEDAIRTGMTGAFDLAAAAATGFKIALQEVLDLVDLLPGASNLFAELSEDMKELRDQRVALAEANRIAEDMFAGGSMPSGLTGDFESDVARLVQLAEERAEAQARTTADAQMEAEIKAGLRAVDEKRTQASEEAAESAALWSRATAEGAASLDLLVDGLEDVEDAIEQTRFDLLFAQGDEEAEKLLDTLDDLLDRQTALTEMTQAQVDAYLAMNAIDFSGMQIPGQGPAPGVRMRPDLNETPKGGYLDRQGISFDIPGLEKLEEDISALQVADMVARSVAALTGQIGGIPPAAQAAIRGISDVIGGLSSIKSGGLLGGITGTVGIVGGIVGLVDGIMGASAEAERQLREATARWEAGLDELGRMFADSTWMEEAQRQIDAALLAQINKAGATIEGFDAATFTSIPDTAELDRLREIFEGMIAAGGHLGDVGQRGIEWLEKVAEAIGEAGDAAERAAEQHRKQIEALEQDLEIRRLVALGMDEEADAMRLQIEMEKEAAAAFALGGKELRDLVYEIWELEEAAREAAEAAKEAAEAQRKAELGADFGADLKRLQIQNSGDEDLLFRFDLRAEMEEMRAHAQKLFDDGIIDQAALDAWLAEVTRFGELAIEDYAEAIREAEEAAKAAAEAERFRAMVDTENLRVRLLQAQGLDKEAMALRQSIELLEAIEQGRSAEYIRLLQQVHEQETLNSMRQQETEAIQETTRSIENMIGVLNGPAGFRINRLLYDFQGPGGGFGGGFGGMASGASGGSAVPVTPFTPGPVASNRAAASSGGSGGDVSVVFNERSIMVQVAAPVGGQISQTDADRIGTQVYDAMKERATDLRARGDYEPFAVTGP